MEKIVLIDDDGGPMELYVEALRRSGYTVVHLDTVDSALSQIEDAKEPPAAYVLDVMMPPGKELGLEETNNGLTSGIAIYTRIRRRFPLVPIVALTNVSFPSIPAQLPADDKFLRRCAKIDVLPYDLADLLRALIDGGGGRA